MILIDEVVMGIAIATLFIGSYEDIKSREVDKFLFIPLVLVGSIGMFFDQVSPSLAILPVILFPVVLFFSLYVEAADRDRSVLQRMGFDVLTGKNDGRLKYPGGER